MRSFTRFGAGLASALVVGAFVAGPASAAGRAETFLGNATGTALHLNLFGTDLTEGFSKATANSQLQASAEAAGQLLAPASTTKAVVTGDNTNQTAAQKCATPALPSQLAAIVNVGVACSSSASSVKNGVPHANSDGSVASLDVSANNVPALNQVIQPVQGALEQVFGPLAQAAPQVKPATDTISTLLTDLAQTKTLSVKLGNSTSDVSVTGTQVTSVSTAAGGRIELLPVGGIAGGPLAAITVGSAKATSVYDRATGKSTPSFDPALVTIDLGLPALGEVKTISVAPGQEQTILQGTPLESTIKVASGSKVTNPDGSVGAIADGVSLQLLKGVQGGVTLQIAHAEAGVAGAPAVVEAPRVAELPRTGGPSPWLPVAGATLLVAAVVTRRFIVSTR